MNNEIMLDLETLGNRPGSVIVAVGAVKFGQGEITDSFYMRVDAQSCVDAGLQMDVQTVMWWLQQSESARLEITKPGQPLEKVLNAFALWVGKEWPLMWGNGAAFDNAILAAAYHALRMDAPWKFYDDRCYRTIKNLYPEITLVRKGTHHNALDDAADQARHLLAIRERTKAG